MVKQHVLQLPHIPLLTFQETTTLGAHKNRDSTNKIIVFCSNGHAPAIHPRHLTPAKLVKAIGCSSEVIEVKLMQFMLVLINYVAIPRQWRGTTSKVR